MTHAKRIKQLATLGWLPETDQKSGDQLQHKICNERCWWIAGKIDGIEWNAWLGETSGMVYLHSGGAPEDRDFEFDSFIEIVRNGWPVMKVAAAVRSLFGDDSY